ncbi:DUF6085 family protein [Streptomyces sp. NPDC003857]
MSDALFTVQGHCPACGWTSLFLAHGGHVTCSRLECPNPCAADELLAGKPEPAPADAPLRERLAKAIYRSDWPRGHWEMRPEEEHDLYREHATAVLAVVQPELDALAALRAVSRGYCPACGRGDAAPTVEDWEQQRQRADQAEDLLRVTHDTSNRSEAERARAVQRAEEAEAWRRKAVRRALKISKLQGTLAAVADLRDDLREITGARWIADALDEILDGQPPAPDAGPTVREAADHDRTHWSQRQWGGE